MWTIDFKYVKDSKGLLHNIQYIIGYFSLFIISIL